MRKYHMCAPIDGDSMTVSAGGGWSSPVGDDRGGRGSDRSRDSSVLSHLSVASNSPKLLSTGGPIIVEQNGLRYVGTIVGEEDNDEKQIDWNYGGTTNKENSNNKSNNQIQKGAFEEISQSHQSEVREFISKGGGLLPMVSPLISRINLWLRLTASSVLFLGMAMRCMFNVVQEMNIFAWVKERGKILNSKRVRN